MTKQITCTLLVFAIAMTTMFATRLQAAPIFFPNNETGFQDALGGNTLSIESFETAFTPGSSVNFPGFTLIAPDGETIFNAVFPKPTDGVGTIRIIDFGFNGNVLIFNFNSPSMHLVLT